MAFKAYLKKEFIEGKRENKIIILAVAFFLLALMSPMLSKIMPDIMADQYGQALADTMKISASECVASYLSGDFVQVCILVVCLALGGVLCEEVTKKYVVLPITKGAKKSVIVLAKFVFYAITLFIMTVGSTFCVICYTYFIFEEDFPSLSSMVYSSIGTYIYVLLILAVILFFSSLVKKSIGAALMSMVVNMALMFANTFDCEYNPYKLIDQASKLVEEIQVKPVILSLVVTVVLLAATSFIFQNKEIES